MSASDETARDLLVAAAHAVGLHVPPVASVAEFEAACLAELDHIRGGQDHGHARNGLRSAVEAARAGNAEYARAGLWEAKKVLELVHYKGNPAHIE